MRHIKTLIIGGGVSGLGCARTLSDAGYKDFLILTKDLGGRVPHSEDGHVNYGAFYVRNDYNHILRFAKKTRRLSDKIMGFYRGHHFRMLFELRNIPHLWSFLRLNLLIHRVYYHYRQLQRRATTESQYQLILRDPLLAELHSISGTELVERLDAQHWAKYFIRPVARATGFVDIQDSSAAMMIHALFPIFVPTYEFDFDFERLIHPFFENIHTATVSQIKRESDRWIVDTNGKGAFSADSLVVAVPVETAQRLVRMTERVNQPVNVYMIHLRGKIKKGFAKEPFVLLSPEHDDIVIAEELNSTYIFYSRRHRTNFDEYFTEYDIITERHWKPAFHMGRHLIELDRGDNLFLANDHNITSMEDSYITGVYAANRILGKANNR